MAVTYPLLGRNGRIGNTMFQLAAVAGTAMARGEDWIIPPFQMHERFPAIARHISSLLPDGPTHVEPRFAYSPIPRSAVRLHGYFQSSRYWQGHAEAVRALLTPDVTFPSNGRVAVHVRRGDYVRLEEYHTNLGGDYYRPALERLRAMGFREFSVFSDDEAWCARNFIGDGIVIMPVCDAVDDMARFMACSAHVIANSSWSWWGAYLAGDAHLVIAPARWFGPKGPPDWQDVYAPGWVVI